MHYKVARSTIYGWKDVDKSPAAVAKAKKKFPSARKGKHLKKGAGRPITYCKEIDDNLIAWVLKQRDLHLPVGKLELKLKAKALIYPTLPNFKTSSGCIEKFMRRHSLSLRLLYQYTIFMLFNAIHYTIMQHYWFMCHFLSCRAKTSIQQKLLAQLEKQLESFMKQVKELRKAHSFSPDMIINMDETLLYFDMPASRTVNKKGERQIRVKSTGAEKRCFTVILACTASGVMLPPMIIFKGKRPLKKLRVPKGAVVMVQKRGGMMHH